jgi:hypothetical protein
MTGVDTWYDENSDKWIHLEQANDLLYLDCRISCTGAHKALENM